MLVMAIAHDLTTTDSWSTGTPSSRTFSHTVSGSNRILIVATGLEDTTDSHRPVSSVTYNGVSLTKIREDDDPTNNITSGLWYLVAPDTGAHNVVVSFGGTIANGVIAATSLTGVNQSGQPEAQGGNKGTGTSVSDSVTTIEDNSWLIDTITRNNTFSLTKVGSQTERYNVSSNQRTAGSTLPVTPPGSTAMGWTLTFSDNWVHSIASIAPLSTALTISVSDSITLTESLVPNLINLTNVSDSITLSENINLIDILNVLVSDSVTVTESVSFSGDKTETLSDNFNDNSTDTSKWTVTSGAVTVNETNQTLEITPATSTPGGNYGKYASNNFYNLTASYVQVQAVQVVTGTVTEQQLIVQIDENNKLTLFYTNGGMVARKRVAGVNDDTFPGYNPAQDVWWRIRESGGTIFMETSPTGATWTTVRSFAIPFAITTLTIELQAGSFDSEATPGKAIFDNFNTGLEITKSESITLAESNNHLLTSFVNVSDTIGVTESINDNLVNLISLSDNVVLDESVSTQEISLVNASESITLTESTNQPQTSVVNVSDNITTTESITLNLISLININDSTSISEAVTVVNVGTPPSEVNISDTITTSEDIVFELEIKVNVNDTVGVNDSISLDGVPNIGVNDSVNVNEVSTVNEQEETLTTESVLVTESLLVALSDPQVSTSDNIGVSESNPLDLPIELNPTETVFVTENQGNLQQNYINNVDNISVTESYGTYFEFGISVSDTITISENVSVTRNNATDLNIVVSDSITITENNQLLNILWVNTSDNATISEALSLELTVTINKSDTITLTEALNLLNTEIISGSDTISITETSTLFSPQLSGIVQSESITVGENIELSVVDITLTISVSDTVSIFEHVQILKEEGAIGYPGVWTKFWGGF